MTRFAASQNILDTKMAVRSQRNLHGCGSGARLRSRGDAAAFCRAFLRGGLVYRYVVVYFYGFIF